MGLLETAGIANARLLVVAIDDRDRAVALVQHVKQNYPGVWVLARAFDRGHGYQLRQAGADDVVSETYRSALELGGHSAVVASEDWRISPRVSKEYISSSTVLLPEP